MRLYVASTVYINIHKDSAMWQAKRRIESSWEPWCVFVLPPWQSNTSHSSMKWAGVIWLSKQADRVSRCEKQNIFRHQKKISLKVSLYFVTSIFKGKGGVSFFNPLFIYISKRNLQPLDVFLPFDREEECWWDFMKSAFYLWVVAAFRG